MVCLIEKMSHCISLFLVPDLEEMGAESLCYRVFGLSYILFFASLASDAVHQIRALASDVVLAGIHSSSAFEGVLQQRTKLAFWDTVCAFSPQWFGGEIHVPSLGVRSVSELLLVMRRFLKNCVILICLVPGLAEVPGMFRKGGNPVACL